METFKYDLSFNQILNQDGSTIVMSWGKTATEKDKQLIASAPELLRALIELSQWVLDRPSHPDLNDLANKVKTAIKKATE